MLAYKRSTRVAELILQELSKIILEFNKPGLGFVTVTGVKLTDDLLDARVFYSVIGTPEVVESSKIILQKSIGHLRHELAGRVNLRRTPTLFFQYDDTSQKAQKIFELLHKIEQEKIEPKKTRRKTIRKATKKKNA